MDWHQRTRERFKPDNQNCDAKYQILDPILEDLRIEDPRKFRAILMPAFAGRELVFLHGKGVPMRNIFAIERDKEIFEQQKILWPGIRQPSRPMNDNMAIEHVPWIGEVGSVDFIYLDYLGQPLVGKDKRRTADTYDSLRRIFQHKLLAPRSVLLLTYGTSRTDLLHFNKNVEALTGKPPVLAYVSAALEDTGHRQPTLTESYSYNSSTKRGALRYCTVKMVF